MGKVKPAKPSVGDDFGGVRIELHRSQAAFLKAVKRHVPGATVVLADRGPGWGARTVSTSQEGHIRLTFFWDEGYRSIKSTLQAIGVNTEWIDSAE